MVNKINHIYKYYNKSNRLNRRYNNYIVVVKVKIIKYDNLE